MDLAADPIAEDVDRPARPPRRMVGRDVRVHDARTDRVPVAAARHASDDLVASAHGLRPERDRTWIVEDDAHEPLRRLAQHVAADEVTLVHLDRKPEAGL